MGVHGQKELRRAANASCVCEGPDSVELFRPEHLHLRSVWVVNIRVSPKGRKLFFGTQKH